MRFFPDTHNFQDCLLKSVHDSAYLFLIHPDQTKNNNVLKNIWVEWLLSLLVWFLLTFVFCLRKIKSIHLEFNTVCYYSNCIACLAVTKGLHLVHFMLLCRPTPSQCFIISVFKGICGSHSCCAFVTESCFHCVKCWLWEVLQADGIIEFQSKDKQH